MSKVLKVIRYGILVFVIIFAAILLLTGKIIKGIFRNPKLITGANPIGASVVVKKVGNAEFSALKKVRKWLGRYVQNHHPAVYNYVKEMF